PTPGGLTDSASTAPGHAPGDQRAGTWVPVAEWVAGPNWGSHFLPRLDVPPSLSSPSVWSPIPYPEEIGREEAFFRRADHRL
ncbi:hypothetical protein, partial [Xanthomonas oryzae]|uniref:hypothetical protein n=1 Tax=Xanthomonas oryzae TaxID=347 RepID=UPI003CEB2BB5